MNSSLRLCHAGIITSLYLIGRAFYYLTSSQGEFSTIRHFERETTFTYVLLQYVVIIVLLYY